MHPIKKILAGLLAVNMSGVGIAAQSAASRPRYIFINETADHRHDLALKMSIKMAEGRSGIENALILLDKLPENVSIEEEAVNLFQRWDIGRTRNGRGILYLYSQQENLFKIEVSYALEGAFPDAACRQLEKAAQTYMLSEIPQDFLSELLITMNTRGRDSSDSFASDFTPPAWMPKQFLSGGAGSTGRGYRPTVEEIQKAVQALRLGERGEFLASTDPRETVERYLESLHRGIGDPQLPLLTSGSQIFRVVVPRNGAQQERVYDYFRKALPYDLRTLGNLGVALFKPGVANLPIVIRRGTDGLWYVDEPKAWTYFHRYEDGDACFPTYDDNPLMPVLIAAGFPKAYEPIYRNRVRTPPAPAYPFSLEQSIGNLEARIRANPKDANLYAQLGEIYYFELNWLTRALENYEKASAFSPERLDYRWRLYHLYINNSEPEKALDELRYIVRKSPNDQEARRWLDFYTKAYQLTPGDFSDR